MGVSSLSSNKTISSLFSTLPLIAGYWDFRCKLRYHFQVCQVSANSNVCCFDVGVSSLTNNKPICYLFSILPFIAGYWDFQCKWQYDFKMCQVSAKTSLSYFDVGVSCLPSKKNICSFLVDILLLLAIETLNDNMMWVCVLCPTINPFVLYIVYFPLLLGI